MKSIEKIINEEFEDLLEIRQPLVNYLKQELPNTPEHVIKDMIYPSVKDANDDDMKSWINDMKDVTWKKYQNFKITKDIFDDKTIEQLNKRLGGENPNQVPRDDERHKTQKKLILKQGMPKEPIILFYNNGKYELWEGWHRTIQLLQLFPQGYIYPNVYVGYKQ